ncbi:MAG: lytic transglycosylase domain-containing protein [Opitutales bacterium]
MGELYGRDERFLIRLAMVLAVVVAVLAFILAKSRDSRVERVAPEEVWSYVTEVSAREDLDPGFVYALVWAESSLNARARSPVARGMMQLTKTAWREVSDQSYRHAWDWKTNIRVGIDYLAFCRDFLKRHDAFSYPLLAASYRYGPYYVQQRGFDLSRVRSPKNEIYQSIFSGQIRPVQPPLASATDN